MAIWITISGLVLSTTVLVIHGDPLNHPAGFSQQKDRDTINVHKDHESLHNTNIYRKSEDSDGYSLDSEQRRRGRFYFPSRVEYSYKEPTCSRQDNFKKPFPDNCNKYYFCENGILRIYKCFFMFNFDPITLSCKWFWQVQCSPTPPPSPSTTQPTIPTTSTSTSTQTTPQTSTTTSTTYVTTTPSESTVIITSTSEGTLSTSTAQSTVSITTERDPSTATAHTIVTSTENPETTTTNLETTNFISTSHAVTGDPTVAPTT